MPTYPSRNRMTHEEQGGLLLLVRKETDREILYYKLVGFIDKLMLLAYTAGRKARDAEERFARSKTAAH